MAGVVRKAAKPIVGGAKNETLTGTAAADLLQGLGGNDALFGMKGADTLHGGAGNDTLDGGAGADRMEGGSGNDSYYVDVAGDTVIESQSGSAGGHDTVFSAVSFTLGANLEDLRLYVAAVTGTGNGLANRIEGNGVGNILSGLGGNDTLLGGAGADKLHGGDGNDILQPGGAVGTDAAGNVAVSGFGGETLDGGAGRDSVVYPNLYDDSDELTLTYMSPHMAINLKAGTAAASHGGTVFAKDSLVSIENVTTGNGDDTITGTGGANVIDSGGGANKVYGAGGDDVLSAGIGTGSRAAGAINSFLYGGDGDDVLTARGSGLSDYGVKDRVTDYLSGGDGDDVLDPGAGLSILNGGAGADEFRLHLAAWGETNGGSGNVWAAGPAITVEDFDRGDGDRFVLSFGDDVTEVPGFHVPGFVGTTAPEVGEIGYAVEEGDTIVTCLFASTEAVDDKPLAITITLEDYTGKLYASDFDVI